MKNRDRKIVKVDEDKLKRMMAGDEEEIRNDVKESLSVQTQENEEEEQEQPQVDSRQEKNLTQARRKKLKTSYSETYLKLNKPILKRPTTIQLSADNYSRIENLLILTPGLSIAMFINNILDNHFEEYDLEIDGVIAERIKKLTNKR